MESHVCGLSEGKEVETGPTSWEEEKIDQETRYGSGRAIQYTSEYLLIRTLQGPRAKYMLYPYYALLISCTAGELSIRL